MNWAIGHNIAGYLPEDEGVVFDNWADAFTTLRAEMRDYADTDDEAAMGELPEDAFADDYPVMLATVDSILVDDQALPDRAWQVWVNDHDGRPVVFWVDRTDEPATNPPE